MTTTSRLEFVRARPEDASVLAAFARPIWRATYQSIIPQAQIDYMLAERFTESSLEIELDHGFTGYFLARTPEGEPCAYGSMPLEPVVGRVKLHQLYVGAQHQGGGIGKTFLRFLKDEARRRGGQEMWLTVNRQNHRAIEFYQRVGFSRLGALVAEIGEGFVMDDDLMICNL